MAIPNPETSAATQPTNLSSTEANPAELHLPTGKKYLNEEEVATLLKTSVRSLRQRESRPPSIQITPRRRIYAEDEVYAWIASRPRVK